MKPLLIAISFLLCFNPGIAQKFYAGVHAGYAFSIASQTLASKTNNNTVQTSSSAIRGSFGKGGSIAAYAGCYFKPKLGAEIEFSYLNGAAYKGESAKDFVFNETTILSGSMFRIAPRLRITLGEKRIKPYIAMGLLFRVFGNILLRDTYTDLQTGSITTSEWKYSKGFSLGYEAAAGASYAINSKISLLAGISVITQSWGPKKGEMTKYTIDHVDMLPGMTPSQKDIDFSGNYTATNYNPSAAWQHRQQLRQYYPFSSIGITMGIHYTFGK